MKNNILVSLSLIIFLICSCSKKEKGTARVKPVKDFVFDTISINDTMTHVFDVKNISDEDLIISKVGTSCGCTAAVISDSVVRPNNSAQVRVEFIARKEKTGDIKNSIVLRTNTEPPFTVFYIKGFVKE
ncbi:DUF1573 domain-containing protein [Flavobacterium sp. J372]|uniref:DUF1573 domain-containing protein n=1 Tax=Flavobacterium sp. J372 TaxID=2898436 RepID=UPI002150E365|nr:DUF1573 domain-containing protein [Flavobacterium sp. J372]MCR5861886.1 DUF1573 domain-containing protein [Flavobacterium sp. J372]